MDVNYEVWGTPETWVDGSTSEQRADIKYPAAAQDTFRENYQNGNIPWNEIDLSLSYWGIGKGSIWANPHLLYPYCPTGTLANLEVDEVSPIEEEVSSIPAIFTADTTVSSTYVSYSRRYKNLYPEEQTTGMPLGNSYGVKLLSGFNYQKVMIVPYVYYYDANTDHGGFSYSTYKDFFDNINNRVGYKILGIAYKIRYGDGETNRTSEGALFGLVWPTEYMGNTGTYDSKPYFASAEGMSHLTETAFMTAGTVPGGIKTTDQRGDATIGTAETGFRKAYCVNTGTSVPIYYYDKDNELWEVYKNTYISGSYTQWVYFPCITVTNDNIQAVQEYLISQIAYLGLPFVIDPAIAAQGKIGDTGVYLPKFDDDGITTGEYEEGATALTLPNAEWVDGRTGSGYDPTKPGGGPIPSSNPMLPVGLNFVLGDKATGLWALTPAEINEVWDDIFNKAIKVEMFGNNPMNAILSLKWTPFIWNSVDKGPIVLGSTQVNPFHRYQKIWTVSQSEKHSYGTIKFSFDKNFYNARNMQARLFLPFYGYYELPTAQLLSSTLRVDFYYDAPDELGVYIISYDDVIYDYCECSVDIEIPITGSNAAALAANKRSEALSIATQVATMGVAAAVGASGIKAVVGGVSQIAAAASESAWAYGGSKIAAAAANIGPLAGEGLLAGMGKGLAGIGSTGLIGAGGISNTISKAQIERASLRTNLPYHGSALQTTFLHLSMKPYVQIFKNTIMQGLNTESGGTVKVKLGGEDEAQYKLKVGHACDVWETVANMPDNSLLQATGLADTNTTGMELAEVQELNGILQSGFYK